jgi:hypothetical protein
MEVVRERMGIGPRTLDADLPHLFGAAAGAGSAGAGTAGAGG